MTAKVVKIIIGDQQILIDRKDLKGIDLSCLRITKDGYAAIGSKLLHRIIMGFPENREIDHKNLNKLDNRKCNLRVCSHSGNMMNRGKQKNNTTGFKGVCYASNMGKFRARVSASKKTYHLGYFKKPEAAGSAYRKAARQLHGKFARVAEGENHET